MLVGKVAYIYFLSLKMKYDYLNVTTKQYFPVEILISGNKVNLTWESVNEKPAARQVLSPRTFFKKVFRKYNLG